MIMNIECPSCKQVTISKTTCLHYLSLGVYVVQCPLCQKMLKVKAEIILEVVKGEIEQTKMKVYCKDCKYYKDPNEININIKGYQPVVHCNKTIKLKPEFIERVFATPHIHNAFNACEYFEREQSIWLKFWEWLK